MIASTRVPARSTLKVPVSEGLFGLPVRTYGGPIVIPDAGSVVELALGRARALADGDEEARADDGVARLGPGVTALPQPTTIRRVARQPAMSRRDGAVGSVIGVL
jgi:hypothetical protein